MERRDVDHLTYLGRWTVSVDLKNIEVIEVRIKLSAVVK